MANLYELVADYQQEVSDKDKEAGCQVARVRQVLGILSSLAGTVLVLVATLLLRERGDRDRAT